VKSSETLKGSEEMKYLVSLIVMLGLGVPATVKAQYEDHAPTSEQCRADAPIWLSQGQQYMDAHDKSTMLVNQLSLVQLESRMREMAQCGALNNRNDYYFTVTQMYSLFIRDRLEHFIFRHHLDAQVLDEDEQGLR
jgi:hypothetical protein